MSVDQVKQLWSELQNDKEKLNNIVQILNFCEDEDPEVVHTSVIALRKAFTIFNVRCTNKKTNVQAVNPSEDSTDTTDAVNAVDVVNNWLREQYTRFLNILLSLVAHKEPGLQLSALNALLDFVKKETDDSSDKKSCQYEFANDLYSRVIQAILTNEFWNEHLLNHFVNDFINKNDDLRYYMLKNAKTIINRALQKNDQTTLFIQRVDDIKPQRSLPVDIPLLTKITMDILLCINMPNSEDCINSFFCVKPPQNHVVLSLRKHQRVFSECWMAFLKLSLSLKQFKQILTNLHSNVIPHMIQPTLLMDFLANAYDEGGIISILSLNSLFILISKYNLDYPDFYKKLYAIFDRNLLHTKYRDRFFSLADIFLSSTHLPAYLVAAFIKRMSRLTLFAPPAAILVILPLIYNLLKRHSSCLFLIHRSANFDDSNTDQYNFDDPELSSCGAMETSLWEIETMKSHYCPAISTFAKTFDEPLTKPIYKISEFVSQNYPSILKMELSKIKDKSAPFAISAPSNLFQNVEKILTY